jgi:hypothetical protein
MRATNQTNEKDFENTGVGYLLNTEQDQPRSRLLLNSDRNPERSVATDPPSIFFRRWPKKPHRT